MAERAPRIPIAAAYQPRTADAYTSLVTNGKGPRIINFVPHLIDDPVTRSALYKLQKRPGYSSAVTPTNATICRNLFWWVSGNLLLGQFFAGVEQLFKIAWSSGLVATSIGSATTGATPENTHFSETSVSGTNYAVVNASSSSAAAYFTDGSSVTQIADAQFPTDIIGPMVHLDGYAFVIDGANRRIANSDLNSLSSWTAGAYFTPNLFPDTPRGLGYLKDKIVCFQDRSLEVLYNAQTTPSPLLSHQDSAANVGIYTSFDSTSNNNYKIPLTQFDDSIYWVSRSERGAIGVHRINLNAGIDKVSSPEVDALLGSFNAALFNIRGLHLFGIPLILVTEVRTGTTLVCNLKDRVWFEWHSVSQFWRSTCESRIDVSGGGTTGAQIFGATPDSGTVFIMGMGTPTYQDNGGTLTATAIMHPEDFGTDNYKFFPEVRVIGDTEASTSNLVLSWSDDDYQTFNSDTRTIDLSQTTKKTHRLGRSRRRAFKMTHSSNTPCRIQALEFPGLSVGSS